MLQKYYFQTTEIGNSLNICIFKFTTIYLKAPKDWTFLFKFIFYIDYETFLLHTIVLKKSHYHNLILDLCIFVIHCIYEYLRKFQVHGDVSLSFPDQAEVFTNKHRFLLVSYQSYQVYARQLSGSLLLFPDIFTFLFMGIM